MKAIFFSTLMFEKWTVYFGFVWRFVLKFIFPNFLLHLVWKIVKEREACHNHTKLLMWIT
jgi:hypothetical protein